jgi:hypothetical protein
MRLPEEQRERGGRRGALALCAIAGAAVFACVALAQESNIKQQGGQPQPAATQPAQGGEAQSADMDQLKRLIEEKMREQGQDPSAAGAGKPAATQRPAQRPRQPRAGGEPPQRVNLSKQAAATTGPALTDEPTSKPAKGCSAGAQSQVDLTPPAPDQPQPRWTVDSETVEAPPTWANKDAKFIFHAKNTGEGVLNILLKGG